MSRYSVALLSEFLDPSAKGIELMLRLSEMPGNMPEQEAMDMVNIVKDVARKFKLEINEFSVSSQKGEITVFFDPQNYDSAIQGLKLLIDEFEMDQEVTYIAFLPVRGASSISVDIDDFDSHLSFIDQWVSKYTETQIDVLMALFYEGLEITMEIPGLEDIAALTELFGSTGSTYPTYLRKDTAVWSASYIANGAIYGAFEDITKLSEMADQMQIPYKVFLKSHTNRVDLDLKLDQATMPPAQMDKYFEQIIDALSELYDQLPVAL